MNQILINTDSGEIVDTKKENDSVNENQKVNTSYNRTDSALAEKNNSKAQIIKELQEQGCVRLSKLIKQGVVSPNDTINIFPLCRIAEKHLKLKESIYRENNSGGKSFEQSSVEILNDIVSLLTLMYPGVKINNISMRQKSIKSFLSKIKGLEIERISKMFAIESDVLNIDSAKSGDITNNGNKINYRINLIKKIEESLYSYLYSQAKKIDKEDIDIIMKKKPDEILQREEILKILLKERIDENIIGKDSEKSEIQERDSFVEQLNTLIDGKPIDFQKTAEMFLDEPRFSKSTKNAIARLIYSRINLNPTMIITEVNGNIVEKRITPDDRRKVRNEFKIQYEEQLNYSSIARIEDSAQDGNGLFYDERYSSEMDRLMDPNGFLKCRDLFGMHIIIQDFDANMKTNNQKIDNNLKNRSKLENQDSEEYREFTQSCVDILGSNFASILLGGINKEYLKNNPKVNEIWKELSRRIKIIDVKYKDKTNGYKATHMKLQIDNNPNYILEVQIKSDYVFEKSKGDGPAAHQNRIGKKRIIPEIIEGDNMDLSNLNEVKKKKLNEEFNYYLPQYYRIVYDDKIKQYRVIKCNTKENCEKFYEDYKIIGRPKDIEIYKKIVSAAERYTDRKEIEIPISSDRKTIIESQQRSEKEH